MNILSDCPDVLTAMEAATALKIGRTTIYRLISRGDIKHIRIGRKIRIPKEYLRIFIENCSEKCYNDVQIENPPCCAKGDIE